MLRSIAKLNAASNSPQVILCKGNRRCEECKMAWRESKRRVHRIVRHNEKKEIEALLNEEIEDYTEDYYEVETYFTDTSNGY